MASPINLVLLGDQTVEKLSSIRALVRRSKTSAGARRLLRDATDVVQLNFDGLSKEERSWHHEISSLLGLAEDNIAESKPNGIIATILMLIGRLGELIVYAEEDASILGSEDDPVHILAFCTGLLPGAALAAARDTNELYAIGIELISIIFRMIREITNRMMLIEETHDSWAYSIVGVTPDQVQPILNDFHAKCNIPYVKRIAIGVVSSGWLTLMGAPSSMKHLMAFSKELDEAPKTKTDTNGAVHTEYIPTFDVQKVLGTSPLLDIPITAKAKMLSPATCQPYAHKTLRLLLGEIMVDIAHNILRVSDTAEALISDFVGKGPVLMTVGGPTGHLPAVQRTLQSRNVPFSIREHSQPNENELSRGGSDLIAIVGMSGRFPGSETVEGFFEDLLESKIQIQKVPKSRFDLDTFFDQAGEKRNTTSTQFGAFMDRPGYFDNRLFNISPREALSMDPLQRLLLTTSYEALEMAGYSKDATLATDSNRIAVYYGQAAEDWSEVMNEAGIDLYYIPGMNRAFGPSRISYHHKWGGGTYALDAACASSSTAIHLACSALKARECDTALAGGGSILVTPNLFAGLSRSGMISDTGGCRTFHDDADGYCRGEGIGVVVLKRLEDAVADNDNILGVIYGSAREYSNTSTSITHPSAVSQARIYEKVLRQTSVVPDEIAYVEMHGTGTQAGDFEEMNSVLKVMGKGRSKDNILTVGAVKANVAHGEGVAGVTSLIKVLMMLRERRIPPQPGLPFKLNHKFPKLDKLNIRIAGISGKDLTLRPSPASSNGKIKCLVNTFDASGGNTSLIVEEPPNQAPRKANPLSAHVVVLSGRSKTSLAGNRKRLLEYLTRNPDVKLADIAYTTTARRMHEALRVAYAVKSTKELTKILRDEVSTNGVDDPVQKPTATHLAFTFTGQGSQYIGMGAQLYQHSASFRDLLDKYQHLAKHSGLPSFLHIISDKFTTIAEQSQVTIQLAIVALEIATANLLRSWGLKPDIVLGHSLGEYSALCVAGVVSVSDTLSLVGQRAMLMEKKLTAGEYSMLAIGKDEDYVRQLLAATPDAHEINIACLNAPDITVVSGPTIDVKRLRTSMEGQRIRSTPLDVAYGFHSQHVEPVVEEFQLIASSVIFSAPRIPVVSTLLGKVVAQGETGVFSSKYLARQTREPVNFTGALRAYKDFDIARSQSCFIEIGPEPVCNGLVRRNLDIPISRLLNTMRSSEDNWTTLATTLATLHRLNAPINWPQFFKDFKGTVSLLDLPKYFFDEKDYWVPYKTFVDPNATTSVQAKEASANDASTPAISTFSTTTLHRVKEEHVTDSVVSVSFSSQVAEPTLYGAIRGHIVNGIHICSLSIFTDMAKSATHYAFLKLQPLSKVPAMRVFDVSLTNALVVANPDPSHTVETTVIYSKMENTAQVSFRSRSNDSVVDHGSIKLKLETENAFFSRLYQTEYLINSRIEALKHAAKAGKAHHMLKPVFYKLFENLVSYDRPYQAVDEVWVDSDCRDAVGTLTMPKTTDSGHYLYNPFWTDAGVQISGFLLNSGLKFPQEITHLATGFESWRLLEEFQAGHTYTSYVSIHDTDTPHVLLADSYVFNDQGIIIQVTTGIRFVTMKRSILGTILDPNGKDSTRRGSVSASASASASRRSSAVKIDSRKQSVVPQSQLTGAGTSELGHINRVDFKIPDTDSTDEESIMHSPRGGASTPATTIDGEEDSVNLFKTLLSVVAQESGCDVGDLEDESAPFADVGMDSLMAITVVAAFLRTTDVELPATFFLDNQTVGAAKAALSNAHGFGGDPVNAPLRESVTKHTKSNNRELMEEGEAESTARLDAETKLSGPDQSPAPSVMTAEPREVSKSSLVSRAVLLQGAPSSEGLKVFFFPDGSGSLSHYIQIPPLGTNINLFGLDSPFLKSPNDYTCSVEVVASSFITAIKAIQPSGPYLLGGYSFGAIYAYEVAKQLTNSAQKVDALIIIDMSVPMVPQKKISSDHTELKDSGLLPPTGRQAKGQKDHLARTIDAMVRYKLTPFHIESRPKMTGLISATTCLSAGKRSPLAQWVQGDPGAARGWEAMVGPVEEATIDADHFAILRNANGKRVSQVCADMLAKL